MSIFLYRIRQVYQSYAKRLSNDPDHEWIFNYLSPEQISLFLAMHPIDQYHSYRVACTALGLVDYYSRKWKKNIIYDRNLLIRVSLLHDIGRTANRYHIISKIIPVLYFMLYKKIDKNILNLFNNISIVNYINNTIKIYINHPQIGADKLMNIGCQIEASIVAEHQKKITPQDSLVLFLLKKADSQN